MDKRTERALRQDFPKDFYDYSFVDALADGISQKPKQVLNNRGGVTQEVKMAKNNQQEKVYHTPEQKIDYFNRRVNDPNLSQGQRNYAAARLKTLSGDSQSAAPAQSGKQGSGCQQCSPTVVTGHDAAFNAGIGYGAAQAGVRVPVSPENKGSFRDGRKQGQALGKQG